jgi:hypothetical protein
VAGGPRRGGDTVRGVGAVRAGTRKGEPAMISPVKVSQIILPFHMKQLQILREHRG